MKLQKKNLKRNNLDLLVLALGNPGIRYQGTRHNVGFRVADAVAAARSGRFRKPLFKSYAVCRIEDAGARLYLVKPLTFMNNSGKAAYQALRTYGVGIRKMLVVCDTLDLSPGTCRLKRDGGDAGHNGLKSIIGHTGTGGFLRLYVGVGHPGRQDAVVDWVLGEPDTPDDDLIHKAVLRGAAAVQDLLSHDVEQVMNELNRKL